MLLERFDVFLFDLDGVVYLGDELLPHAKESLARLRSVGKTVLFLTNIRARPDQRSLEG